MIGVGFKLEGADAFENPEALSEAAQQKFRERLHDFGFHSNEHQKWPELAVVLDLQVKEGTWQRHFCDAFLRKGTVAQVSSQLWQENAFIK